MITQELINAIVLLRQQGWSDKDIAEQVDNKTIDLVRAVLRLSRPHKTVEVLH